MSVGRDKEKGPDPKINLIVHPQQNVIIPVNSFAWLHCAANFTSPESEYDYANDDPSALNDWQFPSEDDYQQSDGPNSVDSVVVTSNDFSEYLCKQEVQYQWFHNGEPIDTMDNSMAETFCNGTIKIKHSPRAEGSYRCLAKTTQPDVGAVVSKAATVKVAGLYSFLHVVELRLNIFKIIFLLFNLNLCKFSV